MNNSEKPLFEPGGVPRVVVVGIVFLSVLLYFALVFRTFRNIEELIKLVPPFIFTGLSIGLVCSCMPFKRPYRTTFFIATAGPILCTALVVFLSIFLEIAFAMKATPDGSLFSSRILFRVAAFALFTGLLHGSLAIVGHYIGGKIFGFFSSFFTVFFKNHANNDSPLELKVAKVSAYSTIFTGLLTAVTTLVVSFFA